MFRDFFKIDRTYWLLVFPILHYTVPWISYRFRYTHAFVFLVIWLFLHNHQILSGARTTLGRAFYASFWWLALYSLQNNIHAIFGHGSLSDYGAFSTTVYQMSFFIATYVTIAQCKWRELRFMTVITLVGICIAGLCAIRGMSIEGLEGARMSVAAATIGADNLDVMDQFSQAATVGLGTYMFVYLCCWLAGPLLIAFSMIKNWPIRILLAVTIFSCYLCVKTGGLGTPFGVMGISIVFYMLWWMTRKRVIMKIVGYCLVISFFLYATVPVVFYPFSAPLKALSELMEEGSSIQVRVSLVADTFSGDKDNYAYDRVKLQLKSVDAFVEHPIFGGGMYRTEDPRNRALNLGGHSFVLDTIARGGIIAIIPFICFLYYMFKFFVEISNRWLGRRWLVMPTLFIILFFFTSIANPTFGVPVVFFYLMTGLAFMAKWSRHELPINPRAFRAPMPPWGSVPV